MACTTIPSKPSNMGELIKHVRTSMAEASRGICRLQHVATIVNVLGHWKLRWVYMEYMPTTTAAYSDYVPNSRQHIRVCRIFIKKTTQHVQEKNEDLTTSVAGKSTQGLTPCLTANAMF